MGRGEPLSHPNGMNQSRESQECSRCPVLCLNHHPDLTMPFSFSGAQSL